MSPYDFDGEKYKKASKHQKEWGNRLIGQLRLKGNESILDLGCGDGVLTEQLSFLVPNGHVLGIDASAGMIQTAKQFSRNNLEFHQMDIRDMSYADEFDVIFSNAALHWLRDHNSLLRSAYHALKPGGILLWNFAGSGSCLNFFETVRQIMAEENYQQYFKNFEWPWFMPCKTEYEELAASEEFREFSVTEEMADRTFADAGEMIRWIDQPSLVPFIQRVPEEKKEAFRTEVIEEMLRKTLRSDGTCFETFRRIRVNALR